MERHSKTKAVFIDRDGTIVHHTKTFVVRLSQLRLFKFTPEAIQILNKAGFLVILITNQPVISRGLMTPSEMDILHDGLFKRIARRGARVDASYVCPHHPDGKIVPYGVKCLCRKPEPGLILKAAKDYNVDLAKSFMVGDALIDVVAGKRAGVKTIRVKTGPGHERLDKMYSDVEPDFVTNDMKSAAEIINSVS